MENKNRIKTNSPSQKAIVDFGVELRRMLLKYGVIEVKSNANSKQSCNLSA